MNGRKIYTCFLCLQGSYDPEICTNCGAKIDPTDIENIVVIPPRWGSYIIPSEILDEEKAIYEINKVRQQYFQNFEVTEIPSGLNIISNERAYENLTKAISIRKNVSKDQIVDSIPFIEKSSPKK